MIYLFTDFGSHDLYVGQMAAVLMQDVPQVPLIHLFNDVSAYDTEAGAHLLHALASRLPRRTGDVFVAVVDPGVGGPRRPVAVQADGNWYVGPDNGLLSIVAQRAAVARWWEITWRPEVLSASFHGRDLFAPVAAVLAQGEGPGAMMRQMGVREARLLESGDLSRIIHVDHYGNAMTGIRWVPGSETMQFAIHGQRLSYAPTFGAVPEGVAFWYGNSLGLVEIAMNQGNAAERMGLRQGDGVERVVTG